MFLEKQTMGGASRLESLFSTLKQPCRIAIRSGKPAILLAICSALVQPPAAGNLNASCLHVLARRGFALLYDSVVRRTHQQIVREIVWNRA